MKKYVILITLVAAIMLLCGNALADNVLGVATTNGVLNSDNTVTVSIAAGEGDVRTYTSGPLTDLETGILMQGVDGGGFGFVNYPLATGALVEALLDDAGNCTDFNVIEKAGVFFDVAKYGGELSPVNGEPGKMVAKGWVLAKTDLNGRKTITLGDGNDTTKLFRETYPVADDCVVYLVDNATDCTLTVGSFADINVTAAIDGHISAPGQFQRIADCLAQARIILDNQNGQTVLTHRINFQYRRHSPARS